jgi:predicted transposase YdaD
MRREWTEEERERQRHQARLKWERDQTAFIDEARMEGQEKGELIGRIHVFEKVLKIPATPKGELSALRIEELQQKAKSLEAQLGLAHE